MQFRLKTLFAVVAVAACVFAVCSGVLRMHRDALRQARRNAILSGNLTSENAPPPLDDEVDSLAEPLHRKPANPPKSPSD